MKQKAATPEKSSVKELNPWPTYIQVYTFYINIYTILKSNLSVDFFKE